MPRARRRCRHDALRVDDRGVAAAHLRRQGSDGVDPRSAIARIPIEKMVREPVPHDVEAGVHEQLPLEHVPRAHLDLGDEPRRQQRVRDTRVGAADDDRSRPERVEVVDLEPEIREETKRVHQARGPPSLERIVRNVVTGPAGAPQCRRGGDPDDLERRPGPAEREQSGPGQRRPAPEQVGRHRERRPCRRGRTQQSAHEPDRGHRDRAPEDRVLHRQPRSEHSRKLAIRRANTRCLARAHRVSGS